MHTGVQNLVNKAKKAWFSIQKSLINSKEKTVKTYIKLIDSLVKPIMLYACETWGDITTKKLLESKVEKFHLSMCKQILGVKKRSNNVSTLSEFARFPLYVDIETQVFKFFQRFIYVQKNKILYKAFQEQISSDLGENTGWLTSIKTKLDGYGLSYIWRNILAAIKTMI